MARLEALSLEEMTLEQKAYYEQIMSRPNFQDLPAGTPLGGPFAAWVKSPDLAASFESFASYVRTQSKIENRLRELAIITVGRIWSAEVEFAAHSALAVRAGIGEEIVEAIRHRQEPSFENNDEAAVCRFAQALTSTYEVDDETYQTVAQALGEQALVELIGLMGFTSWSA